MIPAPYNSLAELDPAKNLGNPEQCDASLRNPINVITGVRFQAERDYEGTSAVALTFVRYYNSLGESDYTEALQKPELIERLGRGELFTLGRYYLNAHLRFELHPLFNLFLTVICNAQDPSGILQPRAVWDVAENFQVTLGGNISFGARGTEYGGFRLPGTSLVNRSAPSIFLWATWYF